MGIAIVIMQSILLVLQIVFAILSFVYRNKSTSFCDKMDDKADKFLFISLGCCALLVSLNLLWLI